MLPDVIVEPEYVQGNVTVPEPKVPVKIGELAEVL